MRKERPQSSAVVTQRKVCRGCHGTGWIRVKPRGVRCAALAPLTSQGSLGVAALAAPSLLSFSFQRSCVILYVLHKSHQSSVSVPPLLGLSRISAIYTLLIQACHLCVWLEVKPQPAFLFRHCFVCYFLLLKTTISCAAISPKRACSFPTFSRKPWNNSDTD